MAETLNTHTSPSGFRPIPSYLRWIAFGVAILMFALAAAIYIGFTRVVVGEHENSVKWLPIAASDICYYRSYAYTAFEFNISEDEFLKWMKSNEWDKPAEPPAIGRYSKIESPVTIGRYTAGPQFKPKPGDPLEHTAKKGYVFERLFKEGKDEGIRVVYDAEIGRAFYTWKPSESK